MLSAAVGVTQATVTQLEQTVSDFEQYSSTRDCCTSLLALANEKLRDSHCASCQDADSLHRGMETLKVCI